MAKVSGMSCDICKTFTTTLNDSTFPEEWIRAASDRQKDLCSNKCLMVLGRERMVATGEKAAISKYKSKSNMDPKLREFLAANGVTGQAIGGKVMKHTVDSHEKSYARPGCLVCQFLEGEKNLPNRDRDSD